MAPDAQTYRVNATQDRVEIDPGKAGEIQFTITNSGAESLETGFKLNVDGDIRPEWCKLTTASGDLYELSLGTNESIQASVKITVPDNARAGASKVSLTSYWVEKPESVFTRGPEVTVATGGPRPFPWKLIIISSSAVLVLLAVILVILFSGSDPVVGFRAVPLTGFAPLKVQFTDASEGKPDKWQWNFGDGSDEVTTQNPEHVYKEPGRYAVMLKATSGRKSDANVVPNMIEVFSRVEAGFEPVPAEGESPLAVTFQNQSTGEAQAFAWDFGDGEKSAEREPSHTFSVDREQTFKVVLRVTGRGDGNTKQIEKTVTVRPKGKASFRPTPAIGEVPLTVQFQDTSTGATSWKWNFGDPASRGSNTATIQNPKHTFTRRNTYRVTLEIQGGVTSTHMIQVFDKPVISSFTASKVKQTGIRALLTGQRWLFKWKATGDIASGVIEFGDGKRQVLSSRQLTAGSVVHDYLAQKNVVGKLTLVGRGGSRVPGSTRVAPKWIAVPGLRVHDINEIKRRSAVDLSRKDVRIK